MNRNRDHANRPTPIIHRQPITRRERAKHDASTARAWGLFGIFMVLLFVKCFQIAIA
jgi:hypothetical protein